MEASGILVFGDSEVTKSLTITMRDDGFPEAPEKFRVKLLEGTIVGGAKIRSPSTATLIINDRRVFHGVGVHDFLNLR
jgi:hypothetical protein